MVLLYTKEKGYIIFFILYFLTDSLFKLNVLEFCFKVYKFIDSIRIIWKGLVNYNKKVDNDKKHQIYN